jgi:hypothetical protein
MIASARKAVPLQQPLEILTSQRVEFADTLDTHTMRLKAQLFSVDPRDVQLVAEAIPKPGIQLGAKHGIKASPKAYMHLRSENIGAIQNLIVMAGAIALIFANGGREPDKASLLKDAEGLLRGAGNAVAEAAYYALEAIQRESGGSS